MTKTAAAVAPAPATPEAPAGTATPTPGATPPAATGDASSPPNFGDPGTPGTGTAPATGSQENTPADTTPTGDASPDEATREADIQTHITEYLQARPAFARTLHGLTTATTDEAPATTTEALAPSAKPAAKEPVAFPVPVHFKKGDPCTVQLGAVSVEATVTGIYYDADGLSYEAEVHVADGIPARGQAARTVKLTVPADLVS